MAWSARAARGVGTSFDEASHEGFETELKSRTNREHFQAHARERLPFRTSVCTQGAASVLDRDGKTIGSIAATLGVSHVEKSKYDITIRCTKDGFNEAVVVDESGTAAASAGRFVADVLITEGALGAVDSISGADNKYDSPVDITLVAKVSTNPKTVLMPARP